jgi:hypothetical protein
MIGVLRVLRFLIGIYGGGYLMIYGFFANPPIPNRWWSLLGCIVIETIITLVIKASRDES